jgi:hypothetical protein
VCFNEYSYITVDGSMSQKISMVWTGIKVGRVNQMIKEKRKMVRVEVVNLLTTTHQTVSFV